MLHHSRSTGLMRRLWVRLHRRRLLHHRAIVHVTDLRELTPYMRWDIGITDIGPTERGWR